MEVWHPIPGYEDFFEVSSFGRVKSISRHIVREDGVEQIRSGKIKRQTKNKDGYLTVSLGKNGTSKKMYVHRLVALAFISKDIDGMDVDHIDFNRENNRVENLRVIPHKDNIKYTKDCGRHVSDRGFSGENNPNFGNHALSIRYRNNPSLSKKKQSRPGEANGRARKVSVLIDGKWREFGCLSDCADYLIRNRLVSGRNKYGVSTYIRIAAESGKKYSGLSFSFPRS